MMFKASVSIATLCLCLMAWAPAAMAEPGSITCKYLTIEVDAAQKRIDESRQAYDENAKIMDKRMSMANAAAKNDENLDDLWADVIETRDQLLPQAREALNALNEGYATMQKYVTAVCDETKDNTLEDRRAEGARRYENSIEVLRRIRSDWHKHYYTPTPAECIALDEAHKNAEAKAKVYSLKNDQKISAYRKARWDLNDAITLDQPVKKKWKTLLKKRKAALPASKGYIDVMKDVFAPVKEGLDKNCIKMTGDQLDAFYENSRKIIAEVTESNKIIKSMPTNLDDFIEQRNRTTSPRIGIINHTDYILCYHLNGTAKGKCVIKPRGTKIVELRQDTFGKPESTMLVTGGVKWEKDEDGRAQVKEMKVCAKQTFDQKSGSKAWTIEPGVEDGCEFPAKEEEKEEQGK